MQCEQLNERLADYWAGALTEAERAAVEAHVATCAACRREAAELGETWRALGTLPDESPSPALEQRFTAMLDAWRDGERAAAGSHASRDQDAGARMLAWRGAPRRTSSRFGAWQPAWQLAAAILLLVTGYAVGRGQPDQAARHENQVARQEIGELRGELHGMREMVALSLMQQESAVERLRGVSFSQHIDAPSGTVLTALLDTLTHDPNPNVRLATIDALREFAGQERVRTGLVQALSTQPSPLVQIALIDAVVGIRERRSVDVLRAIVTDQKTNEAVRERARRGLQQLS
jgi:HEAT repeats/Putative zinc-finger